MPTRSNLQTIFGSIVLRASAAPFCKSSHPVQVFAGAGVDADAVARVDEDGDGDFDAGLYLGLLGDIGGGVAADTGRGFEDLEVNGGREFEFGNLAFDFGQGA